MSSISSVTSLLASAASTSQNSSSVNLGSLLAAATGATTPGIDVNAAVSAAVYALQAPERQWQAQQAALQAQTTALTGIQTAVASVTSDLNSLGDLSGPLSSRTVSSTYSNVATATAAAGTPVGTHVVVVNDLASTASWYSPAVASSTTPLNPAQITITSSTGSSSTIQVGNGVNTLDQLASSINSQGLGVTASIVNDAGGARLALVSNASGKDADFSVSTDSSDLQFTQSSKGKNASLTVDGIPITSATNTVTGAVKGLTINLLNQSFGAQVNLTIAPDASQVSASLAKFVADYNSAIGLVNTQFSFNQASGTQGPLGSDPVVRTLQSTLMQAISYSSGSSTSSGGITSLASLGISVGNDGTLSLDSSKVANAVNNNPSGVQNFFQGAALNGFSASMVKQLKTFTDASSGAFTVDLKSIASATTNLARRSLISRRTTSQIRRPFSPACTARRRLHCSSCQPR